MTPPQRQAPAPKIARAERSRSRHPPSRIGDPAFTPGGLMLDGADNGHPIVAAIPVLSIDNAFRATACMWRRMRRAH